MPQKNNRKGKQNKQQRRGRKSQGGTSVPRHLPLQAQRPSAKRVLVSYGQASSITESAAGLGAVVFYRLNSVYDPDLTGVGTAALGLAYWANFFQNYRVIQSTVRVQANVSGMSAGGLGTVIMAPVPQSTVPASKSAWRCIPYATMRSMNNASTAGTAASMTATYDHAKVLGIKKQEYINDMDYTGGTASNPARAVNLMLSIDSAGSAAVATTTYNIQITYLVEWFNPLPVQ